MILTWCRMWTRRRNTPRCSRRCLLSSSKLLGMDSTSVTRPSSPKAADFVASVLRLQPRIAAFDCDGTLWAGDAGEGFFDWVLHQRLLSYEIAAWARSR